LAKSELHRVEALFAARTVSIQELETAQWRDTTAGKELAAAESAWREAEAALAEFPFEDRTNGISTPTEVRAPVNGRVLRVFEESSRVVTVGTPLLELGDPANLEVVIEVLSRDGAMIAPGARVELEQWGGADALIAQVRLVEPAAFTKISALGVEEQRVNVVADLVTPLAQRRTLGDNFRVEARVVVWASDRALKVPSGALFRRGDRWAALVLEGSRARLRWVTAGRSGGNEIQVLDGLHEQDAVIVYPGDRIRNGQRVRPIQADLEKPEVAPASRSNQP
jgi:HlyD family secretion protein